MKPFFELLLIAGLVALLYQLSVTYKSTHKLFGVELINGETAASKPFPDFNTFYPFYLTQHQNETCRLLHIVGTTIIILFMALDLRILLCGILSALAGVSVFEFTKSTPHGLIEMAFMTITFQVCMSRMYGSFWNKGLALPVIAYGFAWIGHFFFEHNTPATFIYPSYSLLGDFRMLYEYYVSLAGTFCHLYLH